VVLTAAERQALAAVRAAVRAVADAGALCKLAELDGTEVRSDLEEASLMLIHLLLLIEGKT